MRQAKSFHYCDIIFTYIYCQLFCQVPGRAGWGPEGEHASAEGGAAGAELLLQARQLVSAIRRNRFCLLTEMEATEHYLVWLCLQLGIHSQKSIIG